jgi:hypothetical protein
VKGGWMVGALVGGEYFSAGAFFYQLKICEIAILMVEDEHV